MSEPSEPEQAAAVDMYDFAALTYDLYINWRLAAVSMQSVSLLLHELGRFSSVLPGYIDQSADHMLVEHLLALHSATESARNAVKVVEHANDEISLTFAKIDRGVQVNMCLDDAALAGHYGTA